MRKLFFVIGAVVVFASASFAQGFLGMADQDLGFLLSPDNPSGETSFRLTGKANGISILIMSPVELDLLVQTPGSTPMNADQLAASGAELHHQRSDQSESQGILGLIAAHNYSITLPTAEPGLFAIHATAKESLSTPQAVMVVAMPNGASGSAIESGRSLTVEHIGDTTGFAYAGSPMRLGVKVLSQGLPAPGAIVSYRMVEGGSTSTITLLDDGVGEDQVAGDGLYSGTYTSQTTGVLEIYSTIDADPEPAPQDRGRAWSMHVLRPPAVVAGDPAVTPLDEDGDGRFETLSVSAEVQVREEGEYTWRVQLGSPSMPERSHSAGEEKRLPVGLHRMEARFRLAGGLPDSATLTQEIEFGTRSWALTRQATISVAQLVHMNAPRMPPAPIPSEYQVAMGPEKVAALKAEMQRFLDQNPPQGTSPATLRSIHTLGMTPDLREAELAKPPIRLVQEASAELFHRDGGGLANGVLLQAPVELDTGVTLEHAEAFVENKGSMIRATSGLLGRADVQAIRVLLPGEDFLENKIDGARPIRLVLRTSAGTVAYDSVAMTPDVPHAQYAPADPKILAISPARVVAGGTVQVTIRLQDMPINESPGGYALTRGADGQQIKTAMAGFVNAEVHIGGAWVEVQRAVGPDAITAEITAPRDHPLGPQDVEVTVGRRTAVLAGGFTVTAP